MGFGIVAGVPSHAFVLGNVGGLEWVIEHLTFAVQLRKTAENLSQVSLWPPS